MLSKNLQTIIKREQQIIKTFSSTSKQAQNKKNLNILKYELENNPEFDKAHPQFQSKKPKTYIPKQEKHLDFLDSLGLSKRVSQHQTQEELLYQNYETFLEGYKSPAGPMRWMEDSEKEKIHILIDDKMQQLEDSQLSKEEILYEDGRKGLPLSKDPFFQFIKNNRLAREMFIKPGQEFTVQKVIEISLRQDIGTDPSQARSEQKLPQIEELTEDVDLQQKSAWNHFNPDQYYSKFSAKTQAYIKEYLKPESKEHYMPISQSERRKMNRRQIDKFDIHWRNTELLTQFLNDASNIKNHKQNRISQFQQKKIAKSIKVAREMALLPVVGTVKPSDRKSLTTLSEDLEQRTKMAINLQTGHIYVKGHEPSSEQINKKVDNIQQDHDLTIQDRMPEENEQILVQAQVQARKMKEQQLLAQGVDPEQLKQKEKEIYNMESLGPEHSQPNINHSFVPDDSNPLYMAEQNVAPEDLEKSFNNISEKIKEQDITSFANLLVSERAYRLDAFVNNKQQDTDLDMSEQEGLEFLNSVRQLGNLQPLESL